MSNHLPEPSHWHPSCLSNACTTRKDCESEGLAKDNPGTNPITMKPETEPRGRAVLLGSPTLLLSAQAPLPNKIYCFVCTCVSSDNSFPSVRQEPTFKLWKGSLFWQQFDLLAVQRTLKSLLQHHNSKTSILWHSAFFMVQISHPYKTTGKTIVLTI